jgi:hypothetical protein
MLKKRSPIAPTTTTAAPGALRAPALLVLLLVCVLAHPGCSCGPDITFSTPRPLLVCAHTRRAVLPRPRTTAPFWRPPGESGAAQSIDLRGLTQ